MKGISPGTILKKMETAYTITMSRVSPHSIFKKIETKYSITIPDFATIIILLIGVISAIALTVKDFLPLLYEYQYNNVATEVGVVLWDGNFKPPQIVITLPRYLFQDDGDNDLVKLTRHIRDGNGQCGDAICENDPCMTCKKLVEIGWDVWNDPKLFQNSTDLDSESVRIALSASFLKKIADNSSHIGIFDEKYAPWNRPIETALLDFFKWRTESDYILAGPWPESVRGPWSKLTFEKKILDILFSKVKEILCRNMKIREFETPDDLLDGVETNKTCSDAIGFNKFDIPVAFDGYGLWLLLYSNEKPIKQEYHFRFMDKSGLQNNDTKSKSILLFPDTSSFYLTNADGFFYSALDYIPFDGEKNSLHITIRYKVQMRTKESRPSHTSCYNGCYNGSSVQSCFVQCTKDWSYDKCGCIQFTPGTRKSGKFATLPYCTTQNIFDCNITTLPEDVKRGCVDHCKSACEYTSYTYQISTKNLEPRATNSNELVVTVAPMYDSFPELIQTAKSTPEQFFSQLAGIANFYLGISWLSLFAAVVTCVDWWKRFKARERREGIGDQWATHIHIPRVPSGTHTTMGSECVENEEIQRLVRLVQSAIENDLVAKTKEAMEKERRLWINEMKAQIIAEMKSELQQ